MIANRSNHFNLRFLPAPADYGTVYIELRFTSGHGTGDSVCFQVVINNDGNVLEFTEQFEVSLSQQNNDVHFPSLQGSIIVTIIEDPSDGRNKIRVEAVHEKILCVAL